MSRLRASASLDLGVIGNCSFGALIDTSARMVWRCLPRFDGDPVYLPVRGSIESNAFNIRSGAYADTFGGDALDASVLLMAEVGFLRADDKRFADTLDAVQRTLHRGHHMFRYADADDLGVPQTAFNICTFWYIDSLLRVGRLDEARDTFEAVLARRNHVGLLSEDIAPESGELWGNYPQTYSLVGIINAAMRLSAPWECQI